MSAMGKVVLSYSKTHFNPSTKEIPVGGAGHIAQTFYKELQNSFRTNDIIYVDYREHSKLKGLKNVQLLIGISENIQRISKIIKPDRTILLAVNKPWIQRRNIIGNARAASFPIEMLSPQDGIRSNSHELRVSDQVISLGNFGNYQEYSQLMGSSELVFPINFNHCRNFQRQQTVQKTVLVFSGEISFRKGIDIIESLLPFITRKGMCLKIVGNSSNDFLQLRLKQLEAQYGQSFFHENSWIEFKSNKWQELIKDVSFAIFPSREEGQASVLAELISEGIPTIYTEASGLDWVLEQEQPNNSEMSSWVKILEVFLEMSKEGLIEAIRRQQDLLSLMGYEAKQISSLVGRISEGSFWPQIYSGKLETQERPTNYSYVITEDKKHNHFLTIDLDTPAKFDSEGLNRDLVAVVDKYQSINKFVVNHDHRSYLVERINSTNTVIQLRQQLYISIKPTSREVSNKFKLMVLRTLGPWILDRRLSRFYSNRYHLFKTLLKLVSISRARSKFNSEGNGESVNQ
jgi:hypothetical protein